MWIEIFVAGVVVFGYPLDVPRLAVMMLLKFMYVLRVTSVVEVMQLGCFLSNH